MRSAPSTKSDEVKTVKDLTPLIIDAPVQGERKGIRVSRERQAKAVCNVCSVRGECLSYAIEHGERHGVWGGLNESERAALMAS